MVDANITCSTCKKPKIGSKGLTLSQWIFDETLCICAREVSQQVRTQVKLCSACGKPPPHFVTARLTQWIVHPSKCTCPGGPRLSNSGPSAPAPSVELFSLEDGDVPDLELTEELGLDFDRFAVLRQIGHAENLVYCCLDRSLNRKVAVKLICKHSWNESRLIQFQREAKVHSLLYHPNIVRILDFRVSKNNSPYIVMEYVLGTSLEARIKEAGSLPELSAIEVVRQIALGMQHAHDKRIIHRDLKPSNVLLRRSEQIEAVIIDFGIAGGGEDEVVHSYVGNQFSGTPAYVSPEQILGKPSDARADIYSLGCIFFEALTGRPPFEAETSYELFQKHLEMEVPSLKDGSDGKFTSETETLVLKCLAKDPEDRFQEMKELIVKVSELSEKLAKRSGVNELPQNISSAKHVDAPASKSASSSQTIRRRVLLASILVILLGLSPLAFKWANSTMREPEMSKISGNLLVRRWTNKKPVFTEKSPQPVLGMFAGSARKNRLVRRNRIHSHFEGLRIRQRSRSFSGKSGASLDLKGRQLTESDLLSVDRFSRLRQLFITDCAGITGSGLQSLAEYQYLTTLSLENCTLDRKVFSEIARMKGLRTLLLRGVKCQLSECLGQLSDNKIVNIDLSKTNLDRSAIDRLVNIKSLECVGIQECPKVGLASLGLLEKLPRLRVLEISQLRDTQNPKATFARLSHLLGLEELCLSDVTLDGVSLLKILPKLNTLILTNSIPGVGGLEELGALPQLRTLQFDTCKLPKNFAKSISNCRLKELSLIKPSGIDCSSLLPLSAMTTLKLIEIDSLETDKTVLDELRKSLPSCEVAPSYKWTGLAIPPMDFSD